jgi:hypothetical protein
MSWTDSFDSLTNAASDIYTANREASAAQKTADATKAQANASVMSSKNMIIAAAVVGLALVAVVLFRRK